MKVIPTGNNHLSFCSTIGILPIEVGLLRRGQVNSSYSDHISPRNHTDSRVLDISIYFVGLSSQEAIILL